jgi:hypothetical protein
MALRTCSSCDGFLPEEAGRCPHCDAPRAPSSGPAAKAAVAISMVTLMACYGAGPRYQLERPTPTAACSPVDRDGDGFFVCSDGEGTLPRAKDCDDANPQVFPGAPDAPGDGVDQSCDGGDAPPANTNVIAQ